MANFTAVYDACVLYPAPLRDLLIQLALTDLFRARWTDEIHNEWTRNLLENRPELADKLGRTRYLMNKSVQDCLVEGYQSLIGSLVLPDPDDRHVLAAAIHCGADSIVTYNLKDFPAEVLEPFEIEARHPDDFIADQIELSNPLVCEAVKKVRSRLKNPPETVESYLDILAKQGLVQTVSMLTDYSGLL